MKRALWAILMVVSAVGAFLFFKCAYEADFYKRSYNKEFFKYIDTTMASLENRDAPIALENIKKAKRLYYLYFRSNNRIGNTNQYIILDYATTDLVYANRYPEKSDERMYYIFKAYTTLSKMENISISSSTGKGIGLNFAGVGCCISFGIFIGLFIYSFFN